MSGTSNVGTAGVYEAGDQRVPPDAEKPENQATPYEEGKEHSHISNDSSKPSLLPLALCFLVIFSASFWAAREGGKGVGCDARGRPQGKELQTRSMDEA